jgi:hypothetical protein
MDQQNKTKPEENQNKPAELADKELENVAGGIDASVTTQPTKIEAWGDPIGNYNVVSPNVGTSDPLKKP